MPFKTFVAAFFALLLAACNPMEQLDVAEARVNQFHETFNDGNASALYGMTGEEFRAVTTPEEMDNLVALVSDRMGPVQSSERTGFNINAENGVTVTAVTMVTQFEKGEGTETFIFHGQGDEMRLVAWNVDSENFNAMPEVVEVEPAEEAATTE